MISIAPLLTTFPSCTVSIPSIAPEMAMNSVPTPQTFISVSWALWLRTRPNSAPHTPPARIAAVLMIVPSPTIFLPSLFPIFPNSTASPSKSQPIAGILTFFPGNDILFFEVIL